MSSKGSAKKNGGMAKGRSNREKLTLSIRKEKREGGLAKRRMEAWGEKNEETTPAASSSADGSKKTFSVSDFPGMVEGLRSDDLAAQVMNLKGFRRLVVFTKARGVDHSHHRIETGHLTQALAQAKD